MIVQNVPIDSFIAAPVFLSSKKATSIVTRGETDINPAFRALTIQKTRLTDEYLLRELASCGFLPGYGFPTNIVSFDTLNVEELKRQEQKERNRKLGMGGREDNKMRHRDLPNRDAVTALREYAPGADVVMDGQVYRSAGITLNWHAPASESHVKQIQSIRQAWRCIYCGANGTFITGDGLDSCNACGAELQSMGDNRFTYMEPAGFAVDLYEPSHTDVTSQAFLPVVNAWINAEGDWLPLPNAVLGSFRSTSLGRVFNHSGGVNGTGYAICLDCGKAEPMHKDRSAPKFADAKTPHRRLRGAQGNANKECAGSFKPYAVKPALHLGLETVTDVLELQLNGLDGLPISDPVAAYSLAVALRHVIAAALGVETDEIGCDTKPIRHPVKGIGHVIILYDHSAAGYCSSVADRIPHLLSKAREQLDCVAKCQSGCQHCLLSYDTRFRMNDLDRFAALKFLTSEWMQQLNLQPVDAFFGPSSSIAETLSLAESIGREWNKPGSIELRIYLRGLAQDWDIAGSSLKRLLQRWSLHGPVRLVVPTEMVSILSPDQLFAFRQLSQWDAVTVHSSVGAKSSQLAPFAEVINSQNVTRWASRDESCAIPSSLWGQVTSSVLVRGNGLQALEIGEQLELGADHPSDLSPKAGRLELKAELNGLTAKFGTRLLDRIELKYGKSLVEREDAIKSVIYHDRYINSPLPVMLLLSLIKAMRCEYKDAWKKTTLVEIVSVGVPFDDRYSQSATQVFHNWPTTESRDAAIISAFAAASTHAVVRNLPKALASHARVLEIGLESGVKLKIWFDQGFGYWMVPKSTSRTSSTANTRFRFNEPPSFQGDEISKAQVLIEGQAFSTQIFFEVNTPSK